MSDKNIGPFLAFTPSWFKNHQRGLLFLCNAPVIKYWFRYVLRIHKFDCPIDVKITALAPNSFTYGNKTVLETCEQYRKHFHGAELKKWNRLHKKMDCNGYHFAEQKTTDFRTHPKFAKRVYYAFKPMWWAFHAWDWLIADRWIPAASFGFSALETYPGSIGVGNPCDGIVGKSNQNGTWAAIVAASGTFVNQPSEGYFIYNESWGNADPPYWKNLYRSVFCFDTSGLTSVATISSAVMSLRGSSKSKTLSDSPNINIYTSNPGATNALAASDYQTIGTTAQCDTAVTYDNFDTGNYNAFSFNSTGIGNVSKTGISKFAARNANYDASGTTPTFGQSQYWLLQGYYSSAGGTSSDPKLVVTYTSGSIKSINGLAYASVKSWNGLAKASIKSINGLV